MKREDEIRGFGRHGRRLPATSRLDRGHLLLAAIAALALVVMPVAFAQGGGTTATKSAKVTTQIKKLKKRVAALEAKPDQVGQVPSALPPSGAAGGDLTGSYPNPLIGPDAVSGAEVGGNALTGADIDESSLTGFVRSFGGHFPDQTPAAIFSVPEIEATILTDTSLSSGSGYRVRNDDSSGTIEVDDLIDQTAALFTVAPTATSANRGDDDGPLVLTSTAHPDLMLLFNCALGGVSPDLQYCFGQLMAAPLSPG